LMGAAIIILIYLATKIIVNITVTISCVLKPTVMMT